MRNKPQSMEVIYSVCSVRSRTDRRLKESVFNLSL